MLKRMGADIRAMPETDKRSVSLALSAFAQAYVFDRYARICGLTREDYRRTAAQIIEADASRKLEGANAENGLELLIKIGGCTEQGDVPGHIAPTQKGDLAIMYMIGKAAKNEGKNNQRN